MNLLMAADGMLNNPEPVINAVIAALEAQKSAFLTNWLLATLIVMASLVAVGVGISLVMIHRIQEHTNGMHTQLVETTRKLALIEGEVKGRKDQKLEDNVAKEDL